MKKSLVITLALVFVLGIAGTAFAANPFTDVPANHWAYASISKLAQAGIIDGYGDGRFVGNNTMTRYEMAQIVAKAMAKVDSADASQRAQIEKLAAEFADELDSLGVRVAKLEKNADNVKITGEARFGYRDFDGDRYNANTADNFELRSRIWLSGQVNDRWKYGGMFEATENLRNNDRSGDVKLRRAWVDGSIGVVNIMAGRFAYTPVYGVLMDNDADGIKFNYSANNWKFDVFALRPNLNNWLKSENGGRNPNGSLKVSDENRAQMYGAVIGYNNNKLEGNLAYYNVDYKDTDDRHLATKNRPDSVDVYEIALGYRFDQNWKIWGEYVRGDEDINDGGKSGWAAGIDYGKVNRAKAGSFALRAKYYDIPAAATIDTIPELDFGGNANYDGYKGWQLGGSVMMAKNIDFNIDYFDFEGQNKRRTNNDQSLLWTYIRFYF